MNLMKSAILFPRFDPARGPLRVGVLVLDQCNMLSLAAAVDPMRAANRRAERRLFDWQFLSATGDQPTVTAGFSIPTTPVAQATGLDFLITVAGFRLDEQVTPALRSALRRIARDGTTMAGVDGGGWILARAGILDGSIATTHWEDLDRFAAAFPRVQVVRDRYRISGRVMTTGGASPCIDMMLAVIAQTFGADLSARVAAAFIHDPQTAADAPQRAVPTARIARRAPAIARAIEAIEQSLDDPQSVDDLARKSGLSRRRFEQRFRQETGQSPHAYAIGLRLSEARRLALDTGQSVQEIALATGFSSQAAFARAFHRAYGQSVRDLRRKSGLTGR